jgi:hypothetical protein
MATKHFSPAQLAAQKLFAERARSGTLKKGRRKANPKKKTVSEKISQLVHEGYPQKQAVAVALSEQRAGKVKRNPEAIPYGMAEKEKFHLGGRMYAEIVKKSDNSYDYVVFQMVSSGVPGEGPSEQFFDSKNYKTKAGAMRGLEKYVERLGYKINPSKAKPRAYVKRVSQATGAPPSKRLMTRRKKALTAPAGYFPNPKESGMVAVYQVVCMHPKKHVVGIFKTMAEAKQIATAMANANNVPYAIKSHMVQKKHFAV